MINNSSVERWDRLKRKNLDQQFLNEVTGGLACSPFEAEAVLDTVHEVYSDYFAVRESLKPGEIRIQVLAIDARVGQPIGASTQVTVTLTINDDAEDLEVRKAEGVIGLRRHKIKRVCAEAFDQGGLLTVEDLAYRIFNSGERTICRDLAYFRAQNISLPLRSTVKDIGRTLSHRLHIITLWAKGHEYSDISFRACHSLPAIQNYIDKFKRTVALHKEEYDPEKIAFLLRLSPSLVKEYIRIYEQIDMVDHRKEELAGFLKKNAMCQEDTR